ncbi:pectinesterase inhibitor-like [Papaver somniferum]|uniref:pectinesterase inhibitor-like n=1 Tax=Papaver somniferum TaxID=3469 RepID=UPI000E6FB152|nr:pectinesterase inhibitor-like [Papaver somniferum]
MIFSSHTTSSIVSTLFFICLFTTTSIAIIDVKNTRYSSNDIDVEEICSLTKNPSYCSRRLAVFSRVDLFDAAVLTNNWAEVNATEIYNQITDMLPKATNDQKGHLEYCHRLYSACIHDIIASFNVLGSRDFVGYKKQTTAFPNYANLCEESFQSPPSTPSLLTQQNKEFIDLVDIILVVADLLIHQ